MKGIFLNMSNQKGYWKWHLQIQPKDVPKTLYIISSGSLTSVKELLPLYLLPTAHRLSLHLTVFLGLCQIPQLPTTGNLTAFGIVQVFQKGTDRAASKALVFMGKKNNQMLQGFLLKKIPETT